MYIVQEEWQKDFDRDERLEACLVFDPNPVALFNLIPASLNEGSYLSETCPSLLLPISNECWNRKVGA
jgi:hypothetical protein